jgi:hypothetical protein
MSGQLHAPAVLLQGKEPTVAIEEEVQWAPVPVSCPVGNRSPAIQPVAQSYTDCIIIIIIIILLLLLLLLLFSCSR